MFTQNDCASKGAPIPTIRLSEAGAAFLPDGHAAAETAFRDGAGPMDVLATHVAASAIERVRILDVPAAPRAKELAGIVAGFKIHGILWILAAIE